MHKKSTDSHYSFAQYIYGIYLGLNGVCVLVSDGASNGLTCSASALPFLIRSELLLAPLLPLFAAYVVSLLGFNVAKFVLPLYFGS
jgi:hypothetical protein